MRSVILGACLVLLAPASGTCAMLYKSIGPNGVVEFSDVPPTDRSVVVESRPIGQPREAVASANPDGMPLYEDGALARANAQLDLAEHALAEALRAIGSPLQGLRLSASRASPADLKRIDFFRRNVQLARANLLEVLRARQAPEPQAIASR
jgi:hypothetical protein